LEFGKLLLDRSCDWLTGIDSLRGRLQKLFDTLDLLENLGIFREHCLILSESIYGEYDAHTKRRDASTGDTSEGL